MLPELTTMYFKTETILIIVVSSNPTNLQYHAIYITEAHFQNVKLEG